MSNNDTYLVIRRTDQNLRSAVDEMYDLTETLRKKGECSREAYELLSNAVEDMRRKWKSVEGQIILPIREIADELFKVAVGIHEDLKENLEKASKPETPREQAKKALALKLPE